MTERVATPEGARYKAQYIRERSLQLLDYDSIRNNLSQKTTFYRSVELVGAMKPSYLINEVEILQSETSEARYLLNVSSNLSLGGVVDISDPVRRSDLGGILTGQELLEIASSIDSFSNLRRLVIEHSDNATLLGEIARNIADLSYLSHAIKSKVAPNGLVVDAATPTLGILRRQVRDAYTRVTNALDNVIRDSDLDGVIQDDVISVRGDRLVVQVKSNLRGRVPGVVHDASNTGATLFIEPFTTVNLCNSWRELVLEEEREVARVLRDISAQAGSLSQEITDSIEAASELDFILARARLSESLASPDPALTAVHKTSCEELSVKLSTNRNLNLIEARHPLLPEDAVPLSIDVGPNWCVLVITGPNTGGKTVALKTIGLLAAMQQSGIHLPARHGSTLPVFDGIFADIGDQQSIEGSVSTFSSHIRALNDIILNSTDESLVLLDELGSSTNPEEGAAIACAVLEQLGDDGITAVATTHHQSVAATAEASSSMSNASFHLDPVTFRPTYKISIGVPGRSYAMEVASRLGLPDSLLQRAERNLSPDYKRVNKWLTEMNRDREELSSILSDTRTYRVEAKSIRNRLELELNYLLDKRDEIVEAVRREAETKYQHVKDLLSRTESALSWSRYSNSVSGPVENSNLEIEEIKADMEGIEIPEPHTLRSTPESIKPGDTVFVRGLGLTGIVHRLEPGDRDAEIRVGTIRINIETSRLSRIDEEDLPDDGPDEKVTLVPKSLIARSPETQLDIRGLRADPAIELVETFLDSSVKDGLSKVRIIHGKGTGALRHAIRQNLKGHPLVNDFGSETDSRGGDGATYVILN